LTRRSAIRAAPGTAGLAYVSNGSGADGAYQVLGANGLPTPTASTLGGVQSVTCSTSNWFNTLSTGGVFGCSQPNFTDLTGSASVAQITSALTTPPPIGATTPNTAKFSGLTLSSLTGSTQCLEVNSSGTVVGVAGACGTAGAALLSGTVLPKTAAYTPVTGDCGSSITLGGSSIYDLTLNAASGYASNCGFLITNLSTETRAKRIVPNGLTAFFIYPGQSVVISNQSNVWTVAPQLGRYKAPAAMAFFIRPDGSDSGATNDGLANSAAGAFLTASACETNIAVNIDINNRTDVGCTHTCASPPCNITSNSQFLSLTGGTTFVGGAPYYHGDCTTPTNVKLNPGSATTADIQITLEPTSVPFNICGFEFAGGANVSYGIYCGGNCSVDMIGGPWQCDAISATAATGYPAGACMEANSTGHIYFNSNYTTTGSVGAVFSYTNGAYLEVGSAITATGAASLTWAQGYAYGQFGGAAALGSITFSGYSGITGPGCNIGRGASLNINGSAATYFPNGGVTCSVAGGGVSDSAGNRGAIF
jgi:hypothetical protein